jgi:hypothetical protein
VNYLAHGFLHVDDPWFVAGTALPDWLRVLGKRLRLEPASVERLSDDDSVRLARGVLRHQDDDRRFHSSAAFADARHEVAERLRAVLPRDAGHRPSFIAHVLVEMELDASISDEDPMRLEAYYAALAQLEPEDVAAAARRLDPDIPDRLPDLFRRFVSDRFLADYQAPDRLFSRLNLVLRRARQPILPHGAIRVLPAARRSVEARRDELLFSKSRT